MRYLLLPAVLLGAFMLGAQAEPLTASDARASRDEAVAQLVEINNALGDHYFHTGAWDRTVAALERVIRLAPEAVDAYANAAWLLWSTNKTEQALAYYHRLIANNPDNPEAYYIFGQYYFTRKQYQEALPQLQRAVALGLTSPKRHVLGHCLVKLERPQDALAFWRRVLAEEPGNEVAAREINKLTDPPAPDPAP